MIMERPTQSGSHSLGYVKGVSTRLAVTLILVVEPNSDKYTRVY